MSDEHEFHLEGERRPLFGDVRDSGALRAWARTNAETEVALTGRLRSAFVYVMEGTSEHMPVGKAEDVGKETILAALFHDLARREGVVRAFREGERLVDVDGRIRRAAVIVECDLATGAWWLAWRLFGTGEASVGVFHGDWQERAGTTLEQLEEPFREWLDRGTATIETKRHQLLPGPAEDIRAATIPWPPLPPDVPGVGVQIAQAFIPEFLQRPLDFHVIFACREGALERWEVRGRLGVPIDDLIRAIAAQAQAEAVAYMLPSVIELGGVTRRCYRMLVERGGHVGQFVLPLDIKGGKIQGGELKYKDEGPAKHQWIGVAPEHPVDLRMQGPVDGKEMGEG
jgi:hypothetical protein